MSEKPAIDPRPTFDPYVKFHVDLQRAAGVQDEVSSKLAAIDERIDNIQNKLAEMHFKGMPILRMLFGINDSPAASLTLGKALLRVGGLMEEREKLMRQVGFLELAQSDPSFVAWAVGDFDSAIDDIEKGITASDD